MNSRKFIVPVMALIVGALFLSARGQFNGGGGRFRSRGGYGPRNSQEMREQEEMEKALKPEFREDTFTFARLRFDSDTRYGLGRGRSWDDDAPQADLTLTYRLYQLTSLKVRPGVNIVDITPKDLERYPFVYLAAAGRLDLTADEATTLRHYLLNGGFLMVDDFWGDEQWHHLYDQMKQVFPDREPIEMPLSHQIFHNVFDFKKLPQTPSVGAFMNYHTSYDPSVPYVEMGHDPHFYGIYDDKQRLVVLICHNNHFGDGWEHETDDETYFDAFSEPMAYPMFMNIVFYTMTH